MQPRSNEAAPAAKPGAKAAASKAPKRRVPLWSRLPWAGTRRLAIRLGSHGIAMNLYSGRAKAKSAPLVAIALPYSELHGTQVQGSPLEVMHAVEHIAGALSTLQARMIEKSLGDLSGASAEVTIDDVWMLYDVVRADLRPLSPSSADSLANASLADVAGVDPSELLGRWQSQGASAYTLVTGLSAGVMPILDQALRQRGVIMASVMGDFVRAVNAVRDRIDAECAVVAVVRHAGTQLATIVDGVLTATAFEYGINFLPELESRARSMLRVAGVGVDRKIRFYALGSGRLAVSEPWVLLEVHA